jgi:hypothetical protein
MTAATAYAAVLDALGRGTRPTHGQLAAAFLPASMAELSPTEMRCEIVGRQFPHEPLFAFLDHRMRLELDKARERPEWRGRSLAWFAAYLAEAALIAHERAPGHGFIDIALSYARYVTTNRDTDLGIVDAYRKEVVPAWSSRRLDPDANATMITHVARIMGPVLRLLRLADQGLAPQVSIIERERWLAVFAEAFGAFEVDYRPVPGADAAWYLRPVVKRWEPLNHMMILSASLLDAWHLSGERHYLDRTRDLINVLYRSATLHDDGTVSWPYVPFFAAAPVGTPNGGLANQVATSLRTLFGIRATKANNRRPWKNIHLHPSEPIWKACFVMPALVGSETAGIPVGQKLANAAYHTFRVHTLGPNGPGMSLHPNGSIPFNAQTWPERELSFAEHVTGWLCFEPSRPGTVAAITHLVSTRADLYPRGWLNSPHMARGYATNLATTS